jgi:hypothetical protein
MFFRFMIGCWILFGFSVLAIGVGKAGYTYYHGKLETARAATRITSCWSRSADSTEIVEQAEADRDEICQQMFEELIRPAVSKANVAYRVESIGVWMAGVLLLWNLGWHIGHSVRLRRSKSQ